MIVEGVHLVPGFLDRSALEGSPGARVRPRRAATGTSTASTSPCATGRRAASGRCAATTRASRTSAASRSTSSRRPPAHEVPVIDNVRIDDTVKQVMRMTLDAVGRHMHLDEADEAAGPQAARARVPPPPVAAQVLAADADRVSVPVPRASDACLPAGRRRERDPLDKWEFDVRCVILHQRRPYGLRHHVHARRRRAFRRQTPSLFPRVHAGARPSRRTPGELHPAHRLEQGARPRRRREPAVEARGPLPS